MARLAALLAVLLALGVPLRAADNWAVTRTNHIGVALPGDLPTAEMSGVTYLGPVAGGHRFITATENHAKLLQFDLTLDAAGAITAVTNVSTVAIASANDFEGIAYTSAARNSVFLSDENGPGISEISLATGAALQTLTIPTVFTANKRSNRGFESLSRTSDGATMWTANEEALTVDGPVSTLAVGSTVRLLKLNASGVGYNAGPQYAYQVDPIHGPNIASTPQSGLSDLVAMPDGTLLALERSFSFSASPPVFRNRIYEINIAAATDVSIGLPASGLTGQSYTPAAKSLLWSGTADGAANGQNLEGLALGPRLANGSWVLIGVVDNDAMDIISNDTIVAFTAAANPSADFNNDGAVDGSDLILWQRGLGKPIGATHAQGDADRDGDVDQADLQLWKSSVPAAAAATPVPEPATAPAAGAVLAVAIRARRKQR